MNRRFVGFACAALSVALLLWAIIGPLKLVSSGLTLVGMALALLLAAVLLLRPDRTDL